MVTTALIEYIKEELRKGVSPEIITDNLLKDKWTKEDIILALNQLPPQNSPDPIIQAPSSKQSAQNVVVTKLRSFDIKSILSGRIKYFLALFVILFFTIGFLIPVLTVYANVKIPLMTNKFRQGIVLFMYYIPFSPKTSEQIVLAAVDKNAKLTSYTPDFSLSAKVSSADVTAMSLDIKASGPVEIPANNKISYDIAFAGSANLAITKLELNGKLRKIEDDVYVKIESFPDAIFGYLGGASGAKTSPEIKKNLDDLLKNWIYLNTSGSLESEAKKSLDTTQKSIVVQVRDNVQDFLLRSSVLAETKRLKDEKIDGVLSYHLRLVPSKTLIRSLIKEYASQQSKSKTGSSIPLDIERTSNLFSDSVGNLQVDVWFGKNDTILRKTSIVASIKLDGLSSLMGGGYGSGTSLLIPGLSSFANTSLSVATVLKISDIGKKSTFSKPSPIKTLEEFSTGFQNASKTKAQKDADAKQAQFDSNFSNINNALTKYYIKNHSYPTSLSQLPGEYMLPTDPAISNFSQINFQISASKLDFIAFTSIYDGLSYFQYGITSASSYPHKFTKYDIDRILTANPTSPSYPSY